MFARWGESTEAQERRARILRLGERATEVVLAQWWFW